MTRGKDPTDNFTFVVDFDKHDNSELLRAVLPRTKNDYRRALRIYNKFVPLNNASSLGGRLSRSLIASVRFLSLHPKAVNPLDIQTFKAFIEFTARGIKGRITARPTVATIDGFRGNFEAGMSFYREYKFPKETSTTIREV
jgi:carbonic anhydrase